MQKRNYTLIAPNGLTSRASATLVSEANKYKCNLYLLYKNEKANLKSIMNVMSLVIRCNENFTIETNGEDEELAINSFEATMRKIFLI